MAFFSKKSNKKEVKATKEVAKEVATTTASKKTTSESLHWVIKGPRITEKGAILAESNNAYPFKVHPDADKKVIAKAIKEVYKVTPIKVTITKIPTKTVRSKRTGKLGVKKGGKKAYVYLKKGDKIEFI